MYDEEALEIGAMAIHLTDPADPTGDVTLYAGTGTGGWDPTTLIDVKLTPGANSIEKAGNRPDGWNAGAASRLEIPSE